MFHIACQQCKHINPIQCQRKTSVCALSSFFIFTFIFIYLYIYIFKQFIYISEIHQIIDIGIMLSQNFLCKTLIGPNGRYYVWKETVLLTIIRRRSMASLTKVTREDGVETITLASPSTRNALSLDMMLSVTEELTRYGSIFMISLWNFHNVIKVYSKSWKRQGSAGSCFKGGG